MTLLDCVRSMFGKSQPPPQPMFQEMTERFYAKVPIGLMLSGDEPFEENEGVCAKVPEDLRAFWVGTLTQYQLFAFYGVAYSTWGKDFAERILAHQVEIMNEAQSGWGDNHQAGVRQIYNIVIDASNNPVHVKGKNGEDLEVPVEYHVAMHLLITSPDSPYHSTRESGPPVFRNEEDWKLTIDLEHGKNHVLKYFNLMTKVVRFVPET